MLLEEYKRLVDTIDYHMDKYYNEDEPEISDFEYDQLMQQLKAAEKEHPQLKALAHHVSPSHLPRA